MVTLKIRKNPEMITRLTLGIFALVALYFYFKWAEAVNIHAQAELASPLKTTLWISLGMPFIYFYNFIIEEKAIKQQRWIITDESLSYTRKGSLYPLLLPVEKMILLAEIRTIRFESLNWQLERGIKVQDKNGVQIFVPQRTDRFYEAEQFLRERANALVQ